MNENHSTYNADQSSFGSIQGRSLNPFFIQSDKAENEVFRRRWISSCADPKLDISAADASIKISNNTIRFLDRYSENEGANFPFIHEIAMEENISEFFFEDRDIYCSFDLKINAMPSSNYCYSAPDGSYGLSTTLSRGPQREAVYFGVQNLNSVITLFISNCGGKQVVYAPTDKKIGDTMELLAVWRKDRGLDLYLDGCLVLSELEATHKRRRFLGLNSLTFMWLRTRDAAKSHADDADIEISNIQLSHDAASSVLIAENDLCPFTGSGIRPKVYFALDTSRNSIIADMGKVTKINRAVLHTNGTVRMLNKSFLALYVSDDNQNYR